jgi:hypothetical protein
MSFFGLTALGPQNSFAAAAKTSRNIQIFDERDFKAGWEKVVGHGKSTCSITMIVPILEAVFRGPVPPSDRPFVDAAIDKVQMQLEVPNVITFEAFMEMAIGLRNDAEMQDESDKNRPGPSVACEFTSSQQFHDSYLQHRRMKVNAQGKQTVPLTSTQELGWDPQDLRPPVAGRSGSDITKFAAELVKNGVYY